MLGRPSDSTVWQAIDAYLRNAYRDGKLPGAVQARLGVLHQTCGVLLESRAFEARQSEGGDQYLLRLGNQFFPHMKLVVERRGDEWFFRADAHDAHCRPPEGSRESAAYLELVSRNRDIVSAIESDWADCGLPTFKTFLRDDLARRSKTRL